jgi:glycosyltransferase involved in cell wall biosynthesis
MIEKAVRELDAGRIVAVYPSWPFFIAAWIAHRRTGAPLATYYMDVSPEAAQVPWPDRVAIRRYERKILAAARPRLVLSEAIAEDFADRFSFDSVVIPHSIDLSANAGTAEWPADAQRLIVHTGVVEGLQREGLLRLAAAIGGHPELNAKLVLATPTLKSDLIENGFALPCVEIVKLGNTDVRALQRAASVLVAVLPFHGQITAYAQTAFPTKVIEYMTTGAPILAHAPPDSFFARHVSANGYALLVDRPEPAALHKALTILLENRPVADGLAVAARRTLEERYALPKVAERFAEACGLDQSILKPSTGV